MNVDPVWRAVGGWLEAALALFYPPVCQLCGVHRVERGEGYVCGECRARPGGVRVIRPPLCDRCGLPFEGETGVTFECSNCRGLRLDFCRARAAVVATPLILDVIHRYKYGGCRWFEPFLTGLFVPAAAAALPRGDWDMVVPVPLFPVRERHREFNQAVRLAHPLAAATGLPLRGDCVRRVRATRTQTRLSRKERAENMDGAFECHRPEGVRGARVVLVDDVLTTGSTTSSCARALRQAGAAEVCVWTLARGV